MAYAALKINRDGSEQIMLGSVILKEKPARKRAKRSDKPFCLDTLRMREIELVIRRRHGNGVPNPSGTDDFEACWAYLIAVSAVPKGQSVSSWASVWAPWSSRESLTRLERSAEKRKRMMPAETVSKLLGVTMEERTALGLKTIGACDVSAEARKALAADRKKERDRKRQEEKRLSVGMIDRASYEANSRSSTKPWEQEGISRRTWYRRQIELKERGTSLSRVVYSNIGEGDKPVPHPESPSQKQESEVQVDDEIVVFSEKAENACQNDGREASIVGSGAKAPAGFEGAAPHRSGEKGG